MYDLHVIGAGPAGLSSAISAVLNRNAKVLVSDKNSAVGKGVVCSGLMSTNIYSSLNKLGVDPKKSEVWAIYGSHIHVAGVDFEVRRKYPVAHVYDRRLFDY